MSNQTLSKLPRLALIACLAGALAVAFIHTAHAQDSRIVCSSSGNRSFCDADTRGGVMLLRELRNSQQCVEGATWGYTDRGVWVDRGCRAQFELTQAPPPPSPITRIERGTIIPVRTDANIDSRRADGRIYTGTVTEDVRGDDGRVGIPRGSGVELAVRVAPDGDLILDLDSVVAYGQRYSLAADSERIESSREGIGANRRTGEYVGGGALLGSIIGAIAGGGKGAAIGAAAGAAAGAGGQIITRGRIVRVPAESLLTFRVERGLNVGVPDDGFQRGRWHYHNDRSRG